MIGYVPHSRPVDAERWLDILSRVRAAGICIDEQGEEGDRLYWFGCRRGKAQLGFGVSKAGPDHDLYYWCRWTLYWRAPLSTRKLLREVIAIAESARCEADP